MQIKHLHNIKALVLDMDGVLWREREPIGDLPALFSQFQKAGLQVILATNNGTRTSGPVYREICGLRRNHPA